MGRPRATAAAIAAALSLVGAITAVAQPAAAHPPHVSPAVSTAAADAQLIAALQTRMAAAKMFETATLAAVEQRLRAIYATPDEDPVMILLAGNITQAEDLANLSDAVAASDHQLLENYIDALTNLQTAQAELSQNMIRATAGARLVAARAAARHPVTGTVVSPLPSLPSGSGSGGLPSAIIEAHGLPGTAPINPATGRPYPVTP